MGPQDWGATLAEKLDVEITACSDGQFWSACLTGLTAEYSTKARLRPGVDEVTGPDGNTTSDNFCKQVTDLKSKRGAGIEWYMLDAVKAHEQVHVSRLLPELKKLAPSVAVFISAVFVDDTGQGRAAAIAQLKASNDFLTTVNNLFFLYNLALDGQGLNDDAAGGACDQAEENVVNPMITTICTAAQVHGWPTCDKCP